MEQVRRLIAQADVVFPSRDELLWLGFDEAQLAASGLIVCTKAGADGVYLCIGATKEHIPAPLAQEVDPDGAGDNFAGGYVAAVLAGASPKEAVAVGCEVAASSVESFGPMESHIDPSVISRVRARRDGARHG